MFNSKRLVLARTRRRLTAKSLSDLTDLSAMTITRLEKGENQPDPSTLGRIAQVLGYPIEFFYEGDPEVVDTEAVSFRSLTKMSAKEKDAAIAAGVLGLELSDWVEKRFSLPEVNLIDLSYETDVETAASALREHWKLGEKPIGNVLGLLETHGVRVFSLSENTHTVDAFSFWRDEKPYVFLNNYKTAEHSLFDSVHELGHLVLHRHGGPRGQSRTAEREANGFASAFLMPANDVRARVPRFVDANVVIKMKSRWRVSAMAMAYRLHALQRLTEWQYKSICIELGRRGYRSGEPVGIERESSIVWKKVLSHLWQDRTTKNDIAAELRIPLDELEGLIWGVSGSSAPPPSGRYLSLV
jgi:Zn-dependent peptidase ImmA (M78 family)/DNA-binding XRE family transcriptional regulator